MSIEVPQSQSPEVDEYEEMAKRAAAAPEVAHGKVEWEKGSGVYVLPIRDEKTHEVEFWPMDETPGRPMSFIGDTSFKTYQECENWLKENYADAPLLKAGKDWFEKAGIEQ